MSQQLHKLLHMYECGAVCSAEALYGLLSGCVEEQCVVTTRHAHSLLVGIGLSSMPILGNQLIHAFGLCKSLLEADLVFCCVGKPETDTYHAIISVNATISKCDRALILYNAMQKDGLVPGKATILCILKACAAIQATSKGMLIHTEMVQVGLSTDLFIGSTLVSMYAKCGEFEEAHKVLKSMPNGSVVTWNALITGYIDQGHSRAALQLFEKMQERSSIQPNSVTFSSTLKACSIMEDCDQGRLIHHLALEKGLDSDRYVESALVHMYSKCRKLADAHHVFDKSSFPNLVSWNAMIAGYVQQDIGYLALELFSKMQKQNLKADKLTFASVLKACSTIHSIDLGKLMHDHLNREDTDTDLVVMNALIDMYAKCGSLHDARKAFDVLLSPDVVSFGALIAGYIEDESYDDALFLLQTMHQEGLQPCKGIFLCILKACASSGDYTFGKMAHDQLIRSGIVSDIMIDSMLVDIYSRCGRLEEAHRLFDCLSKRDVICWNAMISGYAQHGEGIAALILFKKMQQELILPDGATLSCLLQACGNAKDLWHGQQVHKEVAVSSLDSDLVIGNSLIDMYIRCRSLEDARSVFDALLYRNLVSWGTMITGYVEHGHGPTALELFEEMKQEGLSPDEELFLAVLKTCGSISALEQGKSLHNQVLKFGLDLHAVLGNALIEMYISCAKVEEAHCIFEKSPDRKKITWGVVMSGHAQNGESLLTREFLRDMHQLGLKTDCRIFTSSLSACSHGGGCPEEGYLYLRHMIEDCGLTPTIEHYNCLIDLLARAGQLAEAKQLLQTAPVTPNLITWTSLLAACRKHGSTELAKDCFYQAV